MPSSSDPSIGERIAKARQRRGVTQEGLAEALGIHRQQLSRFETGRSSPSAEQLRALAEHLQVSVDEILGVSGDLATTLSTIRASLDRLEAEISARG